MFKMLLADYLVKGGKIKPKHRIIFIQFLHKLIQMEGERYIKFIQNVRVTMKTNVRWGSKGPGIHSSLRVGSGKSIKF